MTPPRMHVVIRRLTTKRTAGECIKISLQWRELNKYDNYNIDPKRRQERQYNSYDNENSKLKDINVNIPIIPSL